MQPASQPTRVRTFWFYRLGENEEQCRGEESHQWVNGLRAVSLEIWGGGCSGHVALCEGLSSWAKASIWTSNPRQVCYSVGCWGGRFVFKSSRDAHICIADWATVSQHAPDHKFLLESRSREIGGEGGGSKREWKDTGGLVVLAQKWSVGIYLAPKLICNSKESNQRWA